MGEVYLMQDTRVSRQVAIKIIRSEGEPYPGSDTAADANRLFQREAKAIATLDHPNILPLYDFGEESREGATITYMVMPYCADGSLEGWLRQQGNHLLAPLEVAYFVDQAADALQYAHDHEVIHLDVKPSNFLLRNNKKNPKRPTLLLADFGIARNFTTVASSSRTIRGTPTSMAPEQWSSTPVFATDQYALAVMAYELLAGRPPFTGRMEQLMYQHFSVQPPAPSTFNPQLPPAVDEVILRALTKKPEERYPSVSDFASALTQATQGLTTAPSVEEQASQRDAIANYATLSISQSEADAGISRLITLPGGGQMNVPVPAGAYNGQVIRLPGTDNPSGQANPVILTIAIKEPAQAQPAKKAENVVKAPDTPYLGAQGLSNAERSHDLPTIASAGSQVQLPVNQPPARKKTSGLRLGTIGIISIIVVVLLLAGTIFFYVSHQKATPTGNTNTSSHTPTLVVTHAPSPTSTATVVKPGLDIAGTYNGSMFNQNTNQQTQISVFIVQTQGSGALTGSVTYKSPAQGPYQLNGTDDLQGNFSFTVQQPAGQTPLFFYGTVQNGVNLHGNFCSSSAGPCTANTGYFTVGPRI